MTVENQEVSSLEEQLRAFVAQRKANAPKPVLDTLQADIERVAQSGIVEQALKEGQTAPNFTLPGVQGQDVTLSELLDKGPVVVTFYRGDWCPYCNLQLRAYQKALPEIQAAGASLVAISPQTPDNSLTTAEKRDLTYEVLSDVGNVVARRYGLVFRVGDALQTVMKGLGSNVTAYNGDDSWELPIPGTFVIGQDGIVRLAYVNPEYRERLDPSKILEALQKLS